MKENRRRTSKWKEGRGEDFEESGEMAEDEDDRRFVEREVKQKEM
jgi:hypothetical protein